MRQEIVPDEEAEKHKVVVQPLGVRLKARLEGSEVQGKVLAQHVDLEELEGLPGDGGLGLFILGGAAAGGFLGGLGGVLGPGRGLGVVFFSFLFFS